MNTKLLFANSIGFLSIVLWAIGSSVYPFLVRIPSLQILTVCMFIAGILALVSIAWHRQWGVLKQSWQHWLLGMVGINLTNIGFVSAYHYAPAAKVQLLSYLWPLLVVLFSLKFSDRTYIKQYLLATLLGIGAIVLIYFSGQQPQPVGQNPHWGYMFAIMSAICWSAYIVAKHHLGKTPITFLGICMGLGGVLMALGYPLWGPWVAPTAFEWVLLLYAGIASFSVAFMCWDYGTSHGDYKFISVLAYSSPILAIFLMALVGKAKLTVTILLATLLVVGAALLSAWASFKTVSRSNDLSSL